jgi:hypothetical protein
VRIGTASPQRRVGDYAVAPRGIGFEDIVFHIERGDKVSPETVMRDWKTAKVWLLRELSQEKPPRRTWTDYEMR